MEYGDLEVRLRPLDDIKGSESETEAEAERAEHVPEFSEMLTQRTENYLLDEMNIKFDSYSETTDGNEGMVTVYLEPTNWATEPLSLYQSEWRQILLGNETAVKLETDSMDTFQDGQNFESRMSDTHCEISCDFDDSGTFGHSNFATQVQANRVDHPKACSHEPFEGPYNFSLTFPAGNYKTHIYSEKLQKLFCTPFQEIDFQFSYDFDKCNNSQMKLVGYLRYSNPEAAEVPIVRCMTHALREKKILEKRRDVSPDDAAVLQHILKCVNENAVYLEDSWTQQRQVSVPMNRGEATGGYITRTFRFDCLNTCQSSQRGKRTSLLAVFELHEDGMIVGRVLLNLRVCSFPRRDLKYEDRESLTPRPLKRKRRNLVEKDGSSIDASKAEVLNESGSNRNPITTEKPATRASTQKMVKPGAIPAPVQVEADLDPFQSSSQESGISGSQIDALTEDTKQKIQTLLKQAKWILRQCNHENQLVRLMARSFAREIRKTHRSIKAAEEKKRCTC